MNDLLLKGPDVLNPIRAVLLRRGVHAALGDIKKMYNSVWLEDLEMHLHRFLWRDSEDGEIEEYAITSQYWRLTSRVHRTAGNERDRKVVHVCSLEEGT